MGRPIGWGEARGVVLERFYREDEKRTKEWKLAVPTACASWCVDELGRMGEKGCEWDSTNWENIQCRPSGRLSLKVNVL